MTATPKRSPGRPTGTGTGIKYPERFMVRLPEGGVAALRRRAKDAGMKISEYARLLLGAVSRKED